MRFERSAFDDARKGFGGGARELGSGVASTKRYSISRARKKHATYSKREVQGEVENRERWGRSGKGRAEVPSAPFGVRSRFANRLTALLHRFCTVP
eukprot:4637662-Pyramimonas_sp.AAC.1